MEEDDDEYSDDILEAFAEVKNKKALIKIGHNLKKKNRVHGRNKDINEVFILNYQVTDKMDDLGLDSTKVRERISKLKKPEKMSNLVKRKRKLNFIQDAELEAEDDNEMVDEAE